MKKIEYKTMAARERTYWWHVGRLSIIESMLEKMFPERDARILNVGCGTGGTVDAIEKYANELVNVDVSDEAIKFMKKSGHMAVKIQSTQLPFRDSEFDCVVAFDVLEHIEDDSEALKEWRRVLKPGGRVFITVPAYQWLWSGHDDSLYHFRRYTASLLRTRAEHEGLITQRAAYMIVFSTPLVAGFRFLHKLRKNRELTEETSYVAVPEVINKLFIFFLNIEAKLQKTIHFPFGTSVMGIFKK